MRIPRTSIAGLMGAVLVASLGLTALRSGSAIWAGATFLVTCGVLALAVVGAVCRTGAGRAWWLGFALFGGGYLTLVFWAWGGAPWWNLPTSSLLGLVSPRNDAPGGMGGGFCGTGLNALDPIGQTGHCLIGLTAAAIGGLLSLGLFGTSFARSAGGVAEPRPADRPPRGAWLRAAVVGPAGLIVASGLALFGLGRAPGTSAALACFATWGALALAVVGAAFGPRTRRADWLGAALFGIGYMALIFRHPEPPDWPHVATDRLLCRLREYAPWAVREVPDPIGVASSNARIFKALDRPIPMLYPVETPLADVLKEIQAATRDLRIAIYVDPIGLQEVEKTLQSPISIDLEGIPLRRTLSLTLKQLGLTYRVEGGLLTITSAYSDDGVPPPAHEDPFLVVGHCLLALVAAGLGGLLAPKVCRAGASGTGLNAAGPAVERVSGTDPAFPGSPGAVE